MATLIDDATATDYFNGIDNAPEDQRQQMADDLLAWGKAKQSQEYNDTDDHFSKLFTDEAYFEQEKQANAAVQESLDPDQTAKSAAIGAWLEHRNGRPIDPLTYQVERDAYAMANYGKKNLDDNQLFDFISGEYNTQKAKTEAINDLQMQAVGKAITDSQLGQIRPFVDGMTEVFNQWQGKYPELVDGKNAAAFLSQGYKLYYDTINDLDTVRPQASKALSTLTSFTQGNATDEDMQSLANDFVSAPPEDRQKIYKYVTLAAQAGQIDRAGIEQFAVNIGQSFTRGFDFVPQGTLQMQEAGVNNWLESIRNGTQIWVPTDGDLTKAVVGNAPAGAESDAWRQATVPEAETLIQSGQNVRESFKVVRELRNVAKTGVDPIRPVLEEDSFWGTAERGAYGLAGSIPLMGATAVNPYLGVLAYQATEYDRIMLENPDVNPQFAQGLALVEGAANAAIDRVQLSSLSGKLPMFGRYLDRIKSDGVRRTVKIGANVVEQNLQEGAQDLIAPVLETAVASLREDMPDKDFTSLMDEWAGQRAETFFATLPLALIGGGVATYQDIKNPSAELNATRLRQVGFDKEQTTFIQRAENPEEYDARIQMEWEKRTPENIEAGRQEVIAEMQQAATPDENSAKLSETVAEDGTRRWVVTTPDGKELLQTQDQQAALDAIAQHGHAQILNKQFETLYEPQELRQMITDLSTQWTSQDSNNKLIEEEQGINAQQKLEQLQAAGNTAQIQELHSRIANSPIKDTPYDQINILGEASVEDVAEMVFQPLIKINPNTRPENLREEIHHTAVKVAIKNGSVTLDTLRGWLDETEKALPGTFQNLVRDSEGDIVESLAQVQAAYENGKINAAEETKLPASFIGYIKNMMRTLAEVMRRAVALRGAFKDGALPAEYESFLADSVGLNQQARVDTARERVSNEVLTDTNYSIGTNPFPMETKGKWWANEDFAKRGGRIVTMSPDQFLSQVRPLEVDEASRDNIDDIKNMMQSGRKLDPLAIYADGKEDGRHRAIAAKELGMDTLPVLDFRANKPEPKGNDFSIGSRASAVSTDTPSIRASNATITGPANYSIGAFHGTPHKVDKFSTGKIGTGEGAQAYGWGLYFAENRNVADTYMKGMKAEFDTPKGRVKFEEMDFGDGALAADYVNQANGDFDKALQLQAKFAATLESGNSYTGKTNRVRQLLEQWKSEGWKWVIPPGNLYTVELNVEPEDLLDWDKPLSEQSEKVKASLANYRPSSIPEGRSLESMNGKFLYRMAVGDFADSSDSVAAAKSASEFFKSIGIPGIRYLDGGSRSEGQGTFNYVAFDENLIRITEENGNRITATDALAAPTLSATNYSIGKKQDADYLAAVERGDMETVQRMVDEASKAAGYLPHGDFRDSHTAPSGPEGADEEVKNGDADASLVQVARGVHIQPDDYFDPRVGPRYYSYQDKAGMEAFKAIRAAMDEIQQGKKALVTVFRAVPNDIKGSKLENRDWVTPSKTYAVDHGEARFGEGEYRIIKESIPAENLFWDGNDIREWGKDDGKDYTYKNTKNNRKLIAPVTYDENGNVIPLSQRFNPRSANINYSIGKSTDSVTPIAINFPAPDVPSDIKNLRKYIRQMIADSLQGKSIIVERTGTEVKFTAESRAESVSKARTPIQAAPMLEAEKIVLSGIPVDISEPDPNKKTYKGTRLFRRFAIPISIDGDIYASHFTVREPSEYAENSGVFYEFNLGKKIEPEDMGLPLTNASRLPEDNLPFNSDSKINIAALISKVKGGASNYSIASQSEIDRVNRALGGMNRGPDERLKVYERAKQKFSKLMAWNSDELAAMADTGSDDSQIRRTQILQALGELDGILSVLPPEVRGRVGGYTKLAGIAPMDVLKDGEKVSEVSGMNGAIISAWMREGQNIGQAGKQVSLPPGYTATENLSSKRADKAIADFFRDRIKRIDTELEKVLAREYTEAITKAVKQSRPKAGDNGVRKSTLGAETQKFADMVLRATLLDDEATPKRMAEIEAALTNPDATTEDISALSEEWSILNTFGDLDNRSSETLAQGLDWLKGQLQMGREAWRIKEQARIDEQRARARQTIEWLGKGTAKKRNATKTKSELASDLANHYLLSHANFEQFVTAIFPPEIAAKWSERLRKADEASQTAEIRDRKGILDAVRAGAKAANMSTADALLWLKADQKNSVAYLEGRMVKDERIAIDLAQKIVTGEADRSNLSDADVETLRAELAALPADTQKEFVTIKRVIFRGKEDRLHMSRGKAIQYLLSWNQPDVQIKMRKEGWTDESAADLNALVNDPVSREVMAYAKELYGKGAGIVNPVYSRMFGMNMPQVKNYAPTRFLNAKDTKDIGLDGSPTATGTTPGFAKSRVTHSAKIAPEDALTVMQGHIAQQAHWVHFAELAREFRAILSNPEVRESIKQTQGESVLKDAELWADQLEQRGGNKARESTWMNTILGTVLSGKAISSLGFNLKTLAMQLENTIRFGLALDMKQIVSALSNPSAIVEDIQTVWDSPAIQNRLEGGATAEARFLFSRYAGKPNFAAKIAEASMTPINWLDSAGTSISSAIVYRANLNDAIASGMPENLAKQAALNAASEAIYRFAQPVSFGQKSIMENNGNVLAKTFFLFMSDPRLKTAILADAARGLATGRGNASEHIRRIVTVELMAIVSHVISSAFRDTFSDDDDEEIWSLGGFAKAILLAPLQGFFFAGTVGELAISTLTGQKFYTSTQNPLVTSMEQAIRAGTNMEDAINFDDPEAMFKEWNNIFRSMALAPGMAAPAVLLNMVKPVVGLYQNATTED